MSTLHLDAEALYAELLSGVRALLQPSSVLVGIWSGGAWLAERLQRDLKLPGEHGVISSALHRDDFGSRGLTAGADHTRLPFDVNGRPILLIDDVLYTGRTIRAVVNELFDTSIPKNEQQNHYFCKVNKKRKHMGSNQIKEELHEFIEHADDRVLNLIYGMMRADNDVTLTIGQQQDFLASI